MNTTVNYCENGEFTYAPLWYHLQGLSQTASGYGSKLTSAYKTEYNGRLYRVYTMCWSNSGTSYIIVKGERLVLRNTFIGDRIAPEPVTA